MTGLLAITVLGTLIVILGVAPARNLGGVCERARSIGRRICRNRGD